VFADIFSFLKKQTNNPGGEVTKTNIHDAFPLTGNQPVNPELHADELVVFEDAQSLPLFLFQVYE